MHTVLSGIRPTGNLHLGNYLGAVKGMLDLQDDPDYTCFYMVVDVHALTTPYDKAALAQHSRSIIIDYLAAGLDPEKSTLFLQSMVPEHLELAFYFSSVVTMARMQHLPTFKDKVKQHPEHATMALLNYPVLMASDILVYKADSVPVGIDQEPHIEVTREIARKMNAQYELDFPEPQRFATKGEYVPSLSGHGKMSKSVEGSYINLTDDLETIKKRLAAVPTDSGSGSIQEVTDRKGKISKVYTDESGTESPGVANLLTLFELFEGAEEREHLERAYTDGNNGISYGELKKMLAESIFTSLQPIQAKRVELEAQPEYVDEVIQEGARKAQQVARQTVDQVKEQMGFMV